MSIQTLKELLTMKLFVRAFALCLVLAGLAGASLSSSTMHATPSHQSATSAMPIPLCGPGIPCPPQGPDGNLR